MHASSREGSGSVPARLWLRAALLVTLIGTVGCQSPEPTAQADEPLSVVATMSVFADFAEHVGGQHVDVVTIVPVGGDPHTYQPVPSDAILLTRADIVLDNGLGLSPWFESLETNVNGHLVTLTDGIIDDAIAAGGKVDPHMWMVPDFVSDGYIAAIEEALSTVDPANADEYKRNADAYREEVAALDREIAEAMASIPPGQRKMVTSHDAYSYFASHYDLDVVGTITGVSTEEEPSAQSVKELIARIRAEQVPAIFIETTVNPALAEVVARDAGVELADPLYGDSVGPPESEASDYVGMMRSNARAIVDALEGQP